jgi:hypothetical protein
LRADWQNDLIQYYRLFGSTPAPHSNGREALTMISVLIVADEQWAGPALSRRIASDPSIEVAEPCHRSQVRWTVLTLA